MPTYQITTDKGTYQVDTESPNQEQSPNASPQIAVNSNDEVTSALNNLSTATGGNDNSNSNLLNFGDHAKLSFLDPQGQQDYLKKKYKYVEPDGKGNFLYGDNPDSLQPVNQDGVFNDFVSKLGNLTSSIPSIAGQIALTAGTEGMALPLLIGRAAVGSAGGQLLSGLIGSKMQNRVDPEKIAVDTALAGVFGGAGTAAGEALAGGAKAIAQKAGVALDNYRQGLLLADKDPNKFDNAVSTILHMTTGLDKNTIKTGQSLGWSNIFSSEEATNPHGIATIAGDVSKAVEDKEINLGKAVDNATTGLIKDTNNNPVINTTPIASRLLEDLSNAGILNKSDSAASTAAQAKAYGIDLSRASNLKDTNGLPTYSINQNSPLNTKFFQKFLGQLGIEGEGGTFKAYQIDPAKPSMISVSDALKVKKGFQAIVNEGKTITPLEANIAKRALYGNLEEGISGISDQLNKIAQKVNNTQYQAANGEFSSFLNLTSTLKKAGMDVDNPFNSQNYLSHINNATPLSMPLLQQLDKTLGNNFLQRAQAWGVNSKINNISPNFLRLGMVASLFGAGILDPDAGGRGGKMALAGLLGTPSGLKILLKGAGGGYSSLLKSSGGLASKVSSASSNKQAQAILSHLIRNKVTSQ